MSGANLYSVNQVVMVRTREGARWKRGTVVAAGYSGSLRICVGRESRDLSRVEVVKNVRPVRLVEKEGV